jgi:hypothetical protein
MLIGIRRPALKFGDSGIQQAHQFHTPNLSWLHLEVTVKPPFPWETRLIERCGARIRLDSDETLLNMRWKSRDRETGDSETTLEYGRSKLIPIAERDKQGICRLTDEIYILGGMQRTLNEGRHSIQFEIHFGNQFRKSEKYILNVPPQASDNGHFWLRLAS